MNVLVLIEGEDDGTGASSLVEWEAAKAGLLALRSRSRENELAEEEYRKLGRRDCLEESEMEAIGERKNGENESERGFFLILFPCGFASLSLYLSLAAAKCCCVRKVALPVLLGKEERKKTLA